MRNRDILFLVYQNRTGSTFLANQLSAHPQLVVAPEGHGPLKRLIRSIGNGRSLDEQAELIATELLEDPKLSSWEVDPDYFYRRSAEAGDEIELLYALCDAFADTHGPEAQTVVLKGQFFQHLIRRFGYARLQRGRKVGAAFLFRDPRAMFASQRRSLSSRTQEPMQDNPIVAGLRWRQAVGRANRLAQKPNGMMVTYEELILGQQKTLANIARFVGVDPAVFLDDTVSASPKLSDFIPEGQKHLHTNIGEAPIKDRINSWQGELTIREAAIVELFAGGTMEDFGYHRTNLKNIGLADLGAILSLAAEAGARLFRWSRLTGKEKT